MRTPILLLLAATVATPALAAGMSPRDRDDSPQHKHQDRPDRPDRDGRPGGARPMPQPQGQPPRGDANGGDRHHDGGGHPDGGDGRYGGNGGVVPPGQPNGGRPDRGPSGWQGNRPDRGPGGWNGDRPDRGPGGWNGGRPDHGPGAPPPPPRGGDDGRPDRGPGGWQGRPGGWQGGDHGRPGGWDGHRPPPPGGWDRGGPNRGWQRGWRNDNRYDWQRFRTYNRDRFRVGIYYAPGGYSYRPWYAGTRVSPYFFDRRYWLEDPSYFNLPYPPAGCAWVRYFNDVALIELDDGAVLDVIPGFFY